MRYWHKLKQSKSSEQPRNWVFVDTETTEEILDVDTKRQVFRLGVACYVREATPTQNRIEHWFTFTKVETFWDTILHLIELDRKIIILAYNMPFDARILNTYEHLGKAGYDPSGLFAKGTSFILSFKRAKSKLMLLDAMNYFSGSLAQWGTMIGVAKVEVDFTTVSHDELLRRCRVDVEILMKLWQVWQQFLADNDFGHFAPTIPSQAMVAFRHRFMSSDIVIHNDYEAVGLERKSYCGGRVECFHIGKLTKGPFYKLDINSMYPYIMHNVAVPTRLIGIQEGLSKSDLLQLLPKKAIVAEVSLKTNTPCYPVKSKHGLVFPIGEFDTVLAGPELSVALKRKHVKSIGRAAVYTKDKIFASYIHTLYTLRMQYQSQGNPIYTKMIKLMLNSLYGKFGQRNENWVYEGYNADCLDGSYTMIDGDSDRPIPIIVICGHTFKCTGVTEGRDSFVAISSYITSAARAYLWKLIETACRDNVFYCDTDSIITNSIGNHNLSSFLHNTDLGMLKLEETTKSLSIYAPKDYATDQYHKLKGLPKSAVQLSTNEYEYWQWQGIKGSIRSGKMDSVMMHKRTKVLARVYLKGHQSESGLVTPLVFPDDD